MNSKIRELVKIDKRAVCTVREILMEHYAICNFADKLGENARIGIGIIPAKWHGRDRRYLRKRRDICASSKKFIHIEKNFMVFSKP